MKLDRFRKNLKNKHVLGLARNFHENHSVLPKTRNKNTPRSTVTLLTHHLLETLSEHCPYFHIDTRGSTIRPHHRQTGDPWCGVTSGWLGPSCILWHFCQVPKKPKALIEAPVCASIMERKSSPERRRICVFTRALGFLVFRVFRVQSLQLRLCGIDIC